MYKNFIFDAMKEFAKNERKPPMRIYKDEKTREIKEELLKTDSAGSRFTRRNPLKDIHDFIFSSKYWD